MSDIRNDDKGCIVCGNRTYREYYPGLLKCNTCGYIWADLSLSFEDLKKIYNKNYFFGEEYSNYLLERYVLEVGFRKFEKKFSSLFTSNKQKPKLLELGSAYGLFLDVAKRDFDVTGIEISDDPALYCREKGLSVFQGDILDYNNLEKFDLVVSFATLEHLLEPHKVIRKIYQLLKPGGYCYVTTIDIDSMFAKLRGRKWRMIHPPTHASYFSTRTLSMLFQQSDFSILECKPIWQYRSIDALLLPKMEGTVLHKLIHLCGIQNFPIPFNFGDIIGILVQKE